MLRKLRRAVGWLTLAVGAWMMISAQAGLGVEQLRWAARYAFPGEVLLGIAVLCAAYWLLDLRNPLAAVPSLDVAVGPDSPPSPPSPPEHAASRPPAAGFLARGRTESDAAGPMG